MAGSALAVLPAPGPVIGCVKCGDETDHATFFECAACGKTVGYCWACAHVFDWAFGEGWTLRFLRESMDWHVEQRHQAVL